MMQFIDAFDLKNIELGYNEYWVKALKQNYGTWNALLSEEFKWRANNYRNVVFSIEGTQGTGKSAGLLRLLDLTGNIFGNKFSLDHLHFFHENLMKDLQKFKKRTAYAQDEQTRMHGMMSSFVQDELANYEDIYRKPQVNIGYASPSLRTHEHFFIFEAMDSIYLDNKGKPAAVELLLKTKRKSDGFIMPRGVIRLNWVKMDLWHSYEKKKDRFLKKMGGTKGDILKTLEDYADKVLKKHKNDLYSETQAGYLRIKGKEVIDLYINKVVGMRNLTGNGLAQTRAIIKEKLEKEL